MSVLDILCNDDGCLTRVGRPDGFTTWDDSHFTATGSELVIDAAASQLFGESAEGPARPPVADTGRSTERHGIPQH